MKSSTTASFRKAFRKLPKQVQGQARRAYRLFSANPLHPILHFKLVHPTRPIYSVRVALDYRAVGVRVDDGFLWYWIGSHPEYDDLVAKLR